MTAAGTAGAGCWAEPPPLPTDRPVRVTILGSTGSIGTQALEVIRAHPGRFEVVALAAGNNADLMTSQARTHAVRHVGMDGAESARLVREALDSDVEVVAGPDAATTIAGVESDVVINGMTGSRGLAPTLTALASGARLGLANKESLVVGGPLVVDACTPGQIVPIDSEHSALAQCLRGEQPDGIARLILTASGGPFRGHDRAALAGVGPADALSHPTWDMGAVITINSATLANKGLEVIEAHLLFGIDYDRIDVVVHPQSIVHGMVEMIDGATIAKLSPPDMRLPIQLALGWPDRLDDAPARMDWAEPRTLTFEPVDADTFRMLELCIAAGRAGGTAPAVLNAANEEAVAAFLDGRCSFLGIADAVEATLDAHAEQGQVDLAGLLEVEDAARRTARAALNRFAATR